MNSGQPPPSVPPKQVIPLEQLRASIGVAGRTKAVPSVPSRPELPPPIYSLECGEPGFREPEDGEWIVGLYREDDGTWYPLLLWADPDVDYFWDVARRRRTLPPRLYMKLAEQPQIDPKSGFPIIDGAVCPF